MKCIFAQRICTTLALTSMSCYVLLSPSLAMPLYSHLLFYPDYPSRYEAERYQLKSLDGVPRENLRIPSSNGHTLDAWFFRKPGSTRVALVSHGNAGNLSYRTALATDLLQAGVSVLLYDYQGYGLSNGSPTVKHICDDGLATYDYLREKLGYDPKNIILVGESLGCAVACQTSTARTCCALILLYGFSSLKSIACDKFFVLRAYPVALFPKPNLDNVAVLKSPHPPLLIMHGEHDQTVPVSHGKHLFAAAAEPKKLVILPNSGHYIAQEDHDLFMSSLKEFVGSLH
jgi:uncharacterized protein